jgi:hypothetical protein
MKTNNLVLLMMFLVAITMQQCGCDKEAELKVEPCAAESPFKKMYDANVTNNTTYTNKPAAMDLQTHEYKFKTLSDRTVCKVGYQGNANLYTANKSYTIEILDASNTVLYSGQHRFNSTSVDYQPITTTVNIKAGQVYTLKRTVTDNTVPLDQLTGRVLDFNIASGTFPTVALGIIEIISTNYYGRGGPIPNRSLPFIDLIL